MSQNWMWIMLTIHWSTVCGFSQSLCPYHRHRDTLVLWPYLSGYDKNIQCVPFLYVLVVYPKTPLCILGLSPHLLIFPSANVTSLNYHRNPEYAYDPLYVCRFSQSFTVPLSYPKESLDQNSGGEFVHDLWGQEKNTACVLTKNWTLLDWARDLPSVTQNTISESTSTIPPPNQGRSLVQLS